MKKLLIALVVLSISMTACGKDKQEQKAVQEDDKKYNQVTDNTQKTEDKEKKTENVDKKEEVKTETKEVKKEPIKNDVDTKNVSAIYFQKSIVSADKTITSEKVNEYIAKNTKLELKENTPISIKMENGDIKTVEIAETVNILGKYVGLSDTNTVEFEYDLNSFVVRVDEKQIEQLEKVNQDTLLSLELTQNAEDGSVRLVSFKTK